MTSEDENDVGGENDGSRMSSENNLKLQDVISRQPMGKSALIVPRSLTKNYPINQSGVIVSSNELKTFIERQEDYIEQLEKESQFCKDELKNMLEKVREVLIIVFVSRAIE